MKRILPFIFIAGIIALALHLTLESSLGELETLDTKVSQARGHLVKALAMQEVAAAQISTSLLEQLQQESDELSQLKLALERFKDAGSMHLKYQAAQEMAPRVENALHILDQSLKLRDLWNKNAELLLNARNYYNAQVVNYMLALESLPLTLVDKLKSLPRYRTVGHNRAGRMTGAVLRQGRVNDTMQ
jgi:hypothetical protein